MQESITAIKAFLKDIESGKIVLVGENGNKYGDSYHADIEMNLRIVLEVKDGNNQSRV
jgi:hypothetical protein